ncbi:MAG: hypothetical protein AAGF36_01510 [Pseudomonadota bacterium]
MAAEKLKNNFAGRVLGVGLAGLAAITPLAATADDVQAVSRDQELAEFNEARFAAGAYARENNSVAVLFHIGDDVRGLENGDEVMGRVEAHFEQQFAGLGIDAETFSSNNFGTTATGLTFYYGGDVYVGADGAIDLNLQEGIDAIPSVAESLSLYLQTQQARLEVLPEPEVPSGS